MIEAVIAGPGLFIPTTMSESQLLTLSDDHVFSVSGTSVIDAPREEVWKVLLDFQNYGQW